MTLDEIAIKHDTDKSSKFHDYCEAYDRLLTPLRELPIHFLEVGVYFGSSVKMWLEYFPRATIHGIDITRRDEINDARFNFITGDQSSAEFWASLKAPWNPLAFVIDDGSHTASCVLPTFRALWPQLMPGGAYVVEDVFCWFFDTLWDTESHGKRWLAQLLSDVNQGGKSFYGHPEPNKKSTLTDLESQIEWIEFHKGLVIIKKRDRAPALL